MTTNQTIRLVSYAVFAGILATSIGCDETDPAAPLDSTLLLQANPATVRIDPNLGQTEGTTTIRATLYGPEGFALNDVAVTFAAGGGVFSSGGNPVRTDQNGLASDVLTLTPSSGVPITGADNKPLADGSRKVQVTASSALIAEEIQVTVLPGKPNKVPLAAVIAVPRFDVAGFDARPEFPVTFDGSVSVDPDDGGITWYRWEITSNNHDFDKDETLIVEGAGTSSLEFPGATFSAFHNEQDLTVVLRVSDQPVDPGPPAVVDFNGDTFTDQYQIRDCAGVVNQAPTAVIANPDPVIVTGTPGQLAGAVLDGLPSRDPEQFDLDYIWNCGNGSTTPASLARVTCSYRVQSVTQEYVATLTVADHGDNTQSQSGNWCGQKFAGPVSVKVRVSPLQ